MIAGLKAPAVLGDKGYDSEAIRGRGAEPCIPPRSNRKASIKYDRHLYDERNVAERFFGRIKQYPRVATRYDKKAANFLSFVCVASIAIMLACSPKLPNFNRYALATCGHNKVAIAPTTPN